jgi:hypothetical protein
VGLRILAAPWLWWWTVFTEGLAWADRVLALPSGAAPSPARAGALFTAEICWSGAGDIPTIRRYAEEAMEVARSVGDDRRLALAQALGAGALTGLTQTGEFTGVEQQVGLARLRSLSEDAIEIGAHSGDAWVAAWTKMISGLIAGLARDPGTARGWASDAMAEFEELGDSWSRASASAALAFALVQLGELEAAEDALEGSVPALLDVGDLKMANGCLIVHGLIARFTGQADDAARRYHEALELCIRGGDPANTPVCLEGMAAAAAFGDPQSAARLLGAARALFDAGNIPSVPGFEVFYEGSLGLVGETLGEAELERLLGSGASAARTLPLADLAGALRSEAPV